MARFVGFLGALGLLASLASGCDITASGKSGNLEFRFLSEDSLFPTTFNTKIAAGMRADIEVTDAETKEKAPVISASVSPSSVADVAGRSGAIVTVEGLTAGTAELAVETADAEDAIDIKVADVATVDLNYPGPLLVSYEPPVAVVKDAPTELKMMLKDSGGAKLIGYGDPGTMVTVDPAGAATFADNDDVSHLTTTFSSVGDVTITGINDDALVISVVESADVSEVMLEGPGGSDTAEVVAGKTAWVILRGALADGTTVFGLSKAASVSTTTPDFCRISSAAKWGEGVWQVDGSKAGTCTLEATWGTLTATIDVTITES